MLLTGIVRLTSRVQPFHFVRFRGTVKEVWFASKALGTSHSYCTVQFEEPNHHRLKMSKVCLIVIDGWGLTDKTNGNAIHAAQTPIMDALCSGQNVTLDASGPAVGLPEGQFGNSETGHLNIGAGRAVTQDIDRINVAVHNDTLVSNPIFVKACETAKTKSNGRLHLLGLISDGGVHAHIDHLFALLKAAKQVGIPQTFIQFFTDGRDTLPTSAIGYVKQTLDKIGELQYASIATIMGRHYAMDRDTNWNLISVAYDALVSGIGERATVDSIEKVIQSRYDAGEADQMLKPIILNEEGLIRDGDTLLFINYRSDRMREITAAFGKVPGIVGEAFAPKKEAKDTTIFTMTQYNEKYPFPILFPPEVPRNVLAEVVSKAGKKQFHCAETEKYAHVTFFFNGGQEKAFEGEDRLLVPSNKGAKGETFTHDMKPEMRAAEIAEKMAETIASGKYDLVLCNFANPDMVGHTGHYEPTVVACTTTDKAIGVVKNACEKNGYVLLVTADHGNADQMYDDNGGPYTAHTSNRVPFVITPGAFVKPQHNACLADVAPTILDLMGIEKAPEMTGKSLLAK